MDKEKSKTLEKVLVGGLAGTGVVTGLSAGVASIILFRKTVLRPGETSPEIIEEFADVAKMAEYEKKMAPVGEWAAAVPKEDVWIQADDGLRLHAFLIPADVPSKKLVILHHGFTSKAMDNCAHAKFFHEEGYDVLLLDLRAHGQSEGKYVGFGILDRFDTLRWVRYARERFGEACRIVLHGTSMGAATVLMALGLPEIQNSVSAVIADCAYTSPAEIFAHVMKKDYHVPVAAPIIKMNDLYSKKIAGYRFAEYSTLDALKDDRVPVLFIHGKEDKFVPTWMSEKNFEACPARKRLLLVEHAGHGSSIFENPDLYEKTEREFLKDI
ncbi:MAG: alpha/beta hydrolase [Candidatus Limivicinus sp.]